MHVPPQVVVQSNLNKLLINKVLTWPGLYKIIGEIHARGHREKPHIEAVEH